MKILQIQGLDRLEVTSISLQPYVFLCNSTFLTPRVLMILAIDLIPAIEYCE
ncbi:MAG TPA: hypothetical protein VE818_14425 [Nitrososphaeraceae archaeon]|nr:hypothetical protein [Nitrososphaeraceae archaeon]